MPPVAMEIGSYAAFVYSYGYQHTASINLYRPNGSLVAYLRFYAPESTPLSNTASAGFPSSGHASISYPSSAFASVIDILRNEKPLLFYWYPVSPTSYGLIGTNQEPIGEEEGV